MEKQKDLQQQLQELQYANMVLEGKLKQKNTTIENLETQSVELQMQNQNLIAQIQQLAQQLQNKPEEKPVKEEVKKETK